jgi:hypothetical protein
MAMSLDVYLSENGEQVYWANITHNLGRMAEKADIYMHLWRPSEIGIAKAHELIEPVRKGLTQMLEAPSEYEALNAPNGWGTYANFLPWIAKYLEACVKHPGADVIACI